MVSKKIYEKPINEFINLVKQESKIKWVKILNFSFQVFPNVFSPCYSSDTVWFAEKILPFVKNKKFLEIGSGTGVIACLASIHGASRVFATDINPSAIENIFSNAKLHSLDIQIKKGSVFEPIPVEEKFDVIFWNHPFYCDDNDRSEKDILAASVYDMEYKNLKKFFRKGKDHLNKNGLLILGSSNVARINLIKKMAKDYGYKMSLFEKTIVPVFQDQKPKMDLRIYVFESA